jgi:uncharacterized OB-fold protein
MNPTAANDGDKPIRLAPIVTPDAKFFWDAADRSEFFGQKCGDCNRFRFPPRPMCPHCFSVKREEVALSGRGKIYTWIRPQHPPAYGFREPPIVAVIELEEGFRFVSNIEGIAFEQVTAGMPVEVMFADTMGKHKVPVFRPLGRGA